jgi:hypothetical protein
MSLARKKLISSLEAVFHDYVINNDNNIRYPISFKDNSKLKGNYVLRVEPGNEDIFYSGRYQFGANSLFIYSAINSLIQSLERRGLIDELALEELLEEYEEQFERDNEL